MAVLKLSTCALVLASVACTPEFVAGTYYCGLERACPPEQLCDGPTFTCESAVTARPFVCPAGSESSEPNDVASEAYDIGAITCGEPLIDDLGCVADGADVDIYEFAYAVACNGNNPRVRITVRYPIAFMPLAVDLVDDGGGVLASGVVQTTSGDSDGQHTLRVEHPIGNGTYRLHIHSAEAAPDCDGSCGHNQYRLSVDFPLN